MRRKIGEDEMKCEVCNMPIIKVPTWSIDTVMQRGSNLGEPDGYAWVHDVRKFINYFIDWKKLNHKIIPQKDG